MDLRTEIIARIKTKFRKFAGALKGTAILVTAADLTFLA